MNEEMGEKREHESSLQNNTKKRDQKEEELPPSDFGVLPVGSKD